MMPDINVNITGDVTPIAEGVKENLVALPSGLEKLLICLLGDVYTKRIRKHLLTQAQTNFDVTRLLAGEARLVEDGLIVEASHVLSSDHGNETLNARKQILAIKHQNEEDNLMGCIKEAIEFSNNEEHIVSEDAVSDDFVSRWRSDAPHISEPHMQNIWGKILSSEVNQPNSYSLKTLDVLRNISKKEAILFSTLCDYVFFDSYFVSQNDKSGSPDISSWELERLVDSGLIHYTVGFANGTKLPDTTRYDKKQFYLNYGDYCFFFDTEKSPSLSYSRLTTAGRELYKLARNLNEDKARKFCEHLLSSSAFKDVSRVEIGKCIQRGEHSSPTEHLFWVEREQKTSE